MLFLITIVLFIYVLVRIQTIEKKLDDVLKGKAAGQAGVAVPSPVSATPAAPLATSAPVTQPRKLTSFAKPEPAASEIPLPVKPQTANAAEHAQEDANTEFAVGSKMLTGVGVVALFLGVGFFLRYAFENDLISETTRVFLGVILGLIAVGVGHVLRKKYDSYGYTIIGAGFGILYLSVYAAHSFYELIGMLTTFALMVIITALGVGSALLYNSKPLVSYSFVGAFIIPLLLPLSFSVHFLFVYLIILNAGILLIARFKLWPGITVGSLFGTSIIYLSWVWGPYTAAQFGETFIYSTVIFFTYFLTSLLNFVYRDRDYKGVDGLLLYGIPVLYFFLNLTILRSKDEISLFMLAIGFFYIAVSIMLRAAFSQVGDLTKFSNALILVASPFIAGATALHFDGSTLTIMWAVEALVMVLVGYLLKTPGNRIAGIILALGAGMRMIMFDLELASSAELIFNERTATLFFVAIVSAFIWRVYHSHLQEGVSASADEKKAGELVGTLGVYLTLFLWITLEANAFIDDYFLYLPLIWLVYAAVMVSLSFITESKLVRNLSYILVFSSAFIALAAQWDLNLAAHVPFFNIRVGTALAFAVISAYFIWLLKTRHDQVDEHEQKIAGPFLLLANGMVLWAFTFEILGYFNKGIMDAASAEMRSGLENTKRVALSGFWLMYAFAGLAVGIFKRSPFARYFSIILFGVTIFKIFLYDTANLSDVYRFVSFISLGVILLVAGFAYYRFKDRITEFVKIK